MPDEEFDDIDFERLNRLLDEETRRAERLAGELAQMSSELHLAQGRIRVLQEALKGKQPRTALYSRAIEFPSEFHARARQPRGDTNLADAALFVLRKLGRAAHYKEILEQMQATGLSEEATPSGLLNAMRRSELFARVEDSRGYWALSEWGAKQRSDIDPRPLQRIRWLRELRAAEADIAAVEARIRDLEQAAPEQRPPAVRDASVEEMRGPWLQSNDAAVLASREKSRLAFLKERAEDLRKRLASAPK